MKAIPAHPADLWLTKSDPYAPISAPTITSEIQVPTAPDMSRTRRPILSIKKSAGKVLRQLTMPYTPVARREV